MITLTVNYNRKHQKEYSGRINGHCYESARENINGQVYRTKENCNESKLPRKHYLFILCIRLNEFVTPDYQISNTLLYVHIHNRILTQQKYTGIDGGILSYPYQAYTCKFLEEKNKFIRCMKSVEI